MTRPTSAAYRPTYLLRLRPAPDCRVPDAVALRRLLKALAKVYALECVGAWEEREERGAAGANRTDRVPAAEAGA